MPTLSEHHSRQLISAASIPVSDWVIAKDPSQAATLSQRYDAQVVLKVSGPTLAHKTERGLVAFSSTDPDEVESKAAALLSKVEPGETIDGLLISEFVAGKREFIIGLIDDPSYGPTVMLGIGGVFAEVLQDVVFGLAPLDEFAARLMMSRLSNQKLFEEFRGEPQINLDQLASILQAVSQLKVDNPTIAAVDINPLIATQQGLIAVDALVEVL